MSAGRRKEPRRGTTTGPKPGSKADRWRRSAQFRAIANKALADFNARRYLLPKCGAKSKRTGEPCRQIALANGRCRFHGGKTPRGDQWHRLQLPKPGEAGGVEKFDRKSVRQEKRQAKRAREIAAMSPEERERHAAWQTTHKPGKAGERAHRRQQLETGRMLAKVLAEREAAQQASTITGTEDDVFA